MYNKAVVFSPNSDDNLARACAERASCLLRLGDYARALADIEQAGVANSPGISMPQNLKAWTKKL
jgi:hypothetical protein